MTFLSDKTIKRKFNELFGTYWEDFEGSKQSLQASSVELRLGKEVFLSGTKQLITLSQDKPDVTISPGDFAILLAEEKVSIPNYLMGFISIKTKYKNMGLVNISGFHVDPGFRGHLTFSVYNAGPNDILLRLNEELFVIFFAKLDDSAEKPYSSVHQDQEHIPSNAMNTLTGKSVSPQSLDARLEKIENRFQLVWTLLIALTSGIIIVLIRYLK